MLKNVGASPLRAIAAGGIHLHFEGDGTSYYEIGVGTDPVYLDRAESFATVAPQTRLVRSRESGIAARKQVGMNGGRAIPPGRYRVSAAYSVHTAAVGTWWTGSLRSGAMDPRLD